MADRSASHLKKGEQKRGPWTFEEDIRLISYITFNGEGRWDVLAKASGLKRSGRSCRLRWLNYLSPDLNHTNITPEEERWSRIAQSLPGRTDNGIKNYWKTHLKKTIEVPKNGESKVHCRSPTRSSSAPSSSEAPIDLERATDKTKEQKHTVISSFQANAIPHEGQNAAALDGVQIRAAFAQEEYLTSLSYNFLGEIFSCELYRHSEMGYSLHKTPSPEALSNREFYTDELWNMDE